MSAALSTPKHEGTNLVGTCHRIGEIGPSYEVLAIARPGYVRIMMLESGETLDYAVSQARDDPQA